MAAEWGPVSRAGLTYNTLLGKNHIVTATSSNAASIGLLLSGGLDSGILLWHLLQSGRRVQPFYVRCGLVWEEAEMRAVRAMLRSTTFGTLQPLVVLEMPLADLYGHHWSTDGQSTPDAASPDEAVYLPGRNALLTIKPALWCAMHGVEELALGVLASNPFGDATDDFFREFAAALAQATGSRLRFVRPLAKLEKREVMQLGRDLPLELTFSCIAPAAGRHCGRCNKCAERRRAFGSIGMDDPTEYAACETIEVGGER
jgi:7-cyano-7-deazaguanine synthase